MIHGKQIKQTFSTNPCVHRIYQTKESQTFEDILISSLVKVKFTKADGIKEERPKEKKHYSRALTSFDSCCLLTVTGFQVFQVQTATPFILILGILDRTQIPTVQHEGDRFTLLHISHAVKGAIYLGQLGLDDLLAKAILLKLCLQRVPNHQSRVPCTSHA